MKNVYKQKRQEGFTIIEVLIVLAIAALILLIVFLAVPALQRNARNTQRKSDAANLASAITNFEGNNSGAIPTAAGLDAGEPQSQIVYCKGAANPLNGGVTIAAGATAFGAATPTYGCLASNKNFDSSKMGYYKPEDNQVFFTNSGNSPTIVPTTTAASATNINTNSLVVNLGHQCNSTSNGVGASNNRSVAIFYVAEASSGDGTLQCVQA